MNASADAFSYTNYYIGGGTVSKTYLFTNVSLNGNYPFCFIPSDRTVYGGISMQYASTGYPQRTWTTTQSLSNATFNKVLYLLGSGSGVYSTYQTIRSSDGTTIVGASVTAQRQLGGVWTQVADGTTGGDGSVTFWLNPNYQHIITAVKPGCGVFNATITPTQSTYSISMSCNGTTGTLTISTGSFLHLE
jgi:hypothetical protein